MMAILIQRISSTGKRMIGAAHGIIVVPRPHSVFAVAYVTEIFLAEQTGEIIQSEDIQTRRKFAVLRIA